MRSSSRRGFTLIELLVVIAIIAVLAGIIFPVYTGVQRRAELTGCASNLRQIGLCLRQYATDHKSKMPIWGGPAAPGLSTIAADWRASNGVDYRPGLGSVARNLRTGYGKGDYNIFFCPTGLYESQPDAGGNAPTFQWKTEAACDGGEVGYCSVANWLRKDGDMYQALVVNGGRWKNLGNADRYVARQLDVINVNGGEVCVLADNGLFMQTEGKSQWPHDEVGNVLFLDGHVEAIPRNLFIQGYGPVDSSAGGYAAWALTPVP